MPKEKRQKAAALQKLAPFEPAFKIRATFWSAPACWSFGTKI